MGAVIRVRERLVERRLHREASRGFRRPAPPDDMADAAGAGDGDVDLRRLVPPKGLREYWYPALPVRRIPKKEPLFWQMLGDELALFHDGNGGIAAVTDVCPHRGASLSRGKCHYEGTVTCPYHGAVFDGTGECKAFLTEGPASRMPEILRARTYPTRVLRGWVFIWMGAGEPAPIEEDVPPEFFEDEKTLLLTTYTYWPTPWLVALENQGDSHNAQYAHLNSMQQLLRDCARPRTPTGPRMRNVEGRAVLPVKGGANPYADEDGKLPYQMTYPGVGVWPKGRWRQRVWSAFRPWYRHVVFSSWRKQRSVHPYETPDEWANGLGMYSWHLPGVVRINSGYYMYSRYAVPVSENLSRIVYVHNRRIRTRTMRALATAWYWLYFNWWKNYNFSGQDSRLSAPARYWTPETLAPSDGPTVAIRRLVVFDSRDARRAAAEAPEPTGPNEPGDVEVHVR